MKKLIFVFTLFMAFEANAQTSLSDRVALAKNADFNLKLKSAMQQVAIGILTTPLPTDADSLVVAAQKKVFAKNIIEYGGDKYLFAIISSGQVSDASPDLAILGVISQMFNYFAAYKQEQ